jgi:hypothetical protein
VRLTPHVVSVCDLTVFVVSGKVAARYYAIISWIASSGSGGRITRCAVAWTTLRVVGTESLALLARKRESDGRECGVVMLRLGEIAMSATLLLRGRLETR